MQKILKRICAFSGGKIAQSPRRTRAFSALNSVPTRVGATPTACDLQNGIVGKENAKFARRAPKAWSIRGNFATNSGVVDAIFCASSTPDARVFGSARATDSMQHFCDVRKFSQRCRLKLWSIARRHAENLKTNLRIFWRKNCAISAPNARFFSAQQRADPRWSYADGLRFAKRNRRQRKR